MRKLLYIILFILLSISISFGADPYWTDDDGAATWVDCQSATPLSGASACSLSTANSNAAVGDTVYFRAGNYSDAISPSNSGTSGNEITFAVYNSEAVNLTATNYTIYLDNDDYLVFDGFTADVVGWYIYAVNGSDNIEVKNCDFQGSEKYSGVYISNSYDWNIHDNTFGASGPDGGGPMEVNDSERIYIHSNTFNDCGNHSCIGFGDGIATNNSVISNNTFRTTGEHASADSVDTMIMLLKGSSYNVVSGNIFYESGSNLNDDHTAAFKISSGGKYNIFRKNIVYDMDQFSAQGYNGSSYYGDTQYNIYYNNTTYNTMVSGPITGESYTGTFTYRGYTGGDDIQYNQVVNNIISTVASYAFGHRDDSSGTQVHDNIYRGNHLYNITPSDEVNRQVVEMTINEAQMNYPAEYYDNTTNDTSDPLMTDPGNADFTLQSNSPCIDAGLWLTTIDGSTTSTTITVDDYPYFFTNGNGVITGDEIKTESGQTAIISSINYGTKQITFTSAITVVDGEGIALNYNGNTPDIGAEEYGGDPPDYGIENPTPPDGATGQSVNLEMMLQIRIYGLV